jgi:folate-binding protein YgfZ
VRAGIPRFGIDALPEDLPQEAGLVGAVAFGKGCYLGQEAVAKVQNLGHPRRLVVHLVADGAIAAGMTLYAGGDGDVVGRVTSAATAVDGTAVALARIRWDAREAPLRSADGIRLRTAELP